ncbi:MAG: AzlC family ABC transporter permease [Synergistaceae bacterium]|nr:AzlC family ABC transporter permease [Synergistaceae bacterium]
MKNFKRAFKDSLPVLTGYLVLGIGYGILMNAKGYNALWSLAAGLIIYSGTMQFVAIDLFAGASFAATALTSLMVSARHLFYGISMVNRYKNIHCLKKFYMIYALTDETYSLVCESGDENYCFWVSLLDQSYWVIGGFLGGLLGQIIPFNSKGIDFALTALFITICVEQWLNTENHYPALTGLLASVLSLIIFGSENFLIPSMILITVMLFVLRKKIETNV